MLSGLIGRKLGMTQVFLDDGTMEAVTAIEAGPCFVTQIKTEDRDGYSGVQLGFGEARRLNSPEKGHLKSVGQQLKHLREFNINDIASIEIGQKVDVGIFKPGDKVNIVGTSKGKGFAGTVKRYHFSGGPKTHGQSDRHRAPGSIGGGTYPGRVYKGTRMAGHMGNTRITVRHLEVIQADPDRNLLLVRGGVPGAVNGVLLINKSREGKKS
jgi:large subunit ribosomal protein L3